MNTYYVAGFPYSDELYHHGIKGQKWGVRRYQNEDGSLTTLGRIRYGAPEVARKAGSAIASASKAVGRAAVSAAKKVNERHKMKHPNRMSNDELRMFTERLRLEKNYNDAVKEFKKSNMGVVRRKTGEVLSKFGDKMINTGTDKLVSKIFQKLEPDKATNWAEILKDPKKHSDKEIGEAFTRMTKENAMNKMLIDIEKSRESASKKSRGRSAVNQIIKDATSNGPKRAWKTKDPFSGHYEKMKRYEKFGPNGSAYK